MFCQSTKALGLFIFHRRGHHDLRKPPRHSLPQLVLSGERVGEEAFLHHGHVVVGSRRGIGRNRRRELFVQESLHADRLHVRQRLRVHAPGRLFQQARGGRGAQRVGWAFRPPAQTAFEVSEPGSGLITVTSTVPACVLVPVAVSWVAETNVVGRNVPPNDTTAPLTNFWPVTTRVKLPTGMLVGSTAVTTGVGLVKVTVPVDVAVVST